MIRRMRSTLAGALVAGGALFAADAAHAQWGYYGPSRGSSFYFGFSTGPRAGYYRPYDYGVARPFYGAYSAYQPYDGYGSLYSRPRGTVSYDVYSPFGRSEVNYRFRRDGSVRVDVDD